MTDPTQSSQTTGSQAGAGAVAAGAMAVGAAIDKNKSPEQYITEAENKYIVPALVREKFPDLIKLIYETESMNQEEREYWLQIMPIMSEDQISKFRDILVNEKEQLAKLDKEYQQEMQRIGNNKPVADIDEKAMQEKLQNIKAAEAESKASEKGAEDSLLQQLKNL